MTSDIEPFHAIAISRLAHALKAEGRSIIHMEFGQPSTGAPAAAIATAHHVLDSDGLGYWESPALKARLARHYLETYGVTVAPEQFILTCGASPALLLALISSFEPGARIAMARPGYVAYRNTVKALRQIPVEIPCDASVRFQLTAAALAAIEPAPEGVIIASPANPTGTIIEAGELEAIAAVCRARGIRIISDEIYHGLSYVEPARSMLEFAPDALVVSSFSKYFSMVGWRLGWLLASPEHLEKARTYVGNLFLTAPSLSQHAGLVALDCDDELQGHVAVYARNRQLLLDALPRLGLTSIAPPDGAFYIYADIGHLTDNSLEFCQTLLRDTGVATAPGLDFDPVEGLRFIRFSFAVSTAEVEDAIERLAAWFTT
ncbi:aminotransferase class I/II-fold pyridoxal phosphate-dependent enzyme [Asticcacaulis sp.]|uniref:aminotransferase class I/II-fold pyridoxal phosphate-dependent enzyme n=1 Tax=Asticcacaulis sp. TaxID=1872648 RepID=UPI002B811234|nr:aminotransferase class I/II-fold pyridoxal phosphate-dependent enzyme [Asticcacaulis sp.]HTM81736.1 aminotransferase class I/II-fold pyridoxal phosphate-dependent enzyme [Asticcacaulis sp.]